MNKKWFPYQDVVGWILTALLGFVFIASAIAKFLMEIPAEAQEKMRLSASTVFTIGVVELVCAILFLIPQTSIFGLALLTAYMGGACATHLAMGEPFVAQVVIGVLLWIAMVLRYPGILRAPYAGSEPASPPGK